MALGFSAFLVEGVSGVLGLCAGLGVFGAPSTLNPETLSPYPLKP